MAIKYGSQARLSIPLLCLTALFGCGCDSTGAPDKAPREGARSVELMRDTARFYWDKRDYSHAATQYEKVLEQVPDDSEATLGLGTCYAQLGKDRPELFARGAELLQKFNDQMAGPADTRGKTALGILYYRQGNYGAGRMEEATQAIGKTESQISSLNERLVSTGRKAEQRRLRKELNRWHQTLETQEAALASMQKTQKEQLRYAHNSLTEAIAGNPTNDLAYKIRADVNSLRGPAYYGQAIEDLDYYLELKVHMRRERLKAILGTAEYSEDSRKAEAVLAAMDQLDALEAVQLSMRASLLRRLDRQDEAITDLKRLLDLAPATTSAYAEIARSYEELGDYESAVRSYEQYIQALPVGAVDKKANLRMHIQDLEARIVKGAGR